MVDGSDIFGDGVNIAARLQELAEPGGIVVSASVYDQVHNKLSVGFDCLGPQQLKNVTPVTSYRVTIGGRAAGRHGFSVEESSVPSHGSCRLGGWRSTDSRPIRAIHVDEFGLGSGGEPASPRCRDTADFGLVDPDQCFHQSAPNLVSLASRSVGVHWHHADSAPAETSCGRK